MTFANRVLFASILMFGANTSQAAVNKSAKKIEADRVTLTSPAVIETGDNLLGVRTATGAAFDGATVLGANFERIVHPNFGLGLQAHYANYQAKFSMPGIEGEYNNDAWTFVGYGAFHVNVFKVRNLDTYFSAGVAHSVIRGDFKAKVDGPLADKVADIKSTRTFGVGYINARYFLDSTFSFTVALGTGLGNFGIGMDVLF